MRKLTLLGLTVLLCATASSPVTGQVVMSRGSASHIFGPAICGTSQGVDRKGQPLKECRQPAPLDYQEALRRAALAAVERHVAQGGEDQARAFERIRDSARSHLDEIVVTTAELNRVVDSTTRTITMAVRVEINEARLRNMLQATSSIARRDGDKSLMGLFLVARAQVSVQSFGPENRTESSVSTTTAAELRGNSSRDTTFRSTEQESLKGATASFDGQVSSNGSTAADSSSRRSVSVSATEQSTSLERAAKVTYSVAPAEDLDALIGGRLAAAGYETVGAAFLEDDATPGIVEIVRMDFGSGDDLKPSTVRRIAAAAAQQQVRYALVGTVDLSLAGKDEVTEYPRMYAKVKAKVYDVSGRLPRTLANVGPAQYSGIGQTPDVARTNALRNAAAEIARGVLDQLSNRAIR